MKRRELIGALAGSAGFAATMDTTTAAASRDGRSRPRVPARVDGRMLLNRPRALALMEQYDIDGIVAANPVNIYYLANTMPIGAKMRWEYPAFATLARDPRQPAFLVTTTAQSWDLVNGDREVPELITYSSIQGPGYAVRDAVPLTPREQRWAASQKRYNPDSERSPALGLIRALRESGLANARVAVDDLRVKYLLEEAGFTGVQCLPGDGLFRLIRMVKSEPEIALMRIAGRGNGDAALATIRAIERGMRYEDVEQRFRLEAAQRGNDIAFILAGMSLGLFPDGEVVAGKPFLVDAVSRFCEYHGDFARTVCVGEPSREVRARAKASQIGRDAVFELVRPGVRFSELRRVAFEAMVKAGMPGNILVINPHSVGLQHTDHPATLGLPGALATPIDHVLEENMTLTIDLPYIEVGWGAGHNEDLIRVTRSGYEALNAEGDPLVIV